MNDMHQVGEDLSFVREALRRSDERVSPPSVYVLWALIVFAGMPLFDISPRTGGMFWCFAGPIGGALSGWLGWRWSRRVGQESREQGRRHGLHWTAMMFTILATVPLVPAGLVASPSLGRIILLIVAFGYFTAGIYLDRPMLWLGLVAFACYAAMFFVTSYPWTLTGAVLSGSLLITAWIGGRRAAPAA